MTDLEITKRCAEMVGITIAHVQDGKTYFVYHPMSEAIPKFNLFDPLHDDAQAMALVKKFGLRIGPTPDGAFNVLWGTKISDEIWINSSNLNRAICECVAKMQESKHVQTNSANGHQSSESRKGNSS